MRRGFSLVELSIVLVILGLLTGGILAGQSLIRTAELRSITSDLARYQTSYYAFRDKYFALPGDFATATRFWGIRTGSGSTTGSDIACHQTLGVTTGTCNGNGDGQINTITSDLSLGERFATWQHLAMAGLIEGSYTGASAMTTAESRTRGVNVPAGRVNQSLFVLGWMEPAITGNINQFDNFPGGHALHAIGGDTTKGIIMPEEMWNLDSKMDDGKAATGRVRAYKKSSLLMPNCTTGDAASDDYDLSLKQNNCYVMLLMR